MGFVAQRAWLPPLPIQNTLTLEKLSQDLCASSLPSLVGKGLPAGWLQHVGGVLTLAVHAEAVVVLWTGDVDPSSALFQFVGILCGHRWRQR